MNRSKDICTTLGRVTVIFSNWTFRIPISLNYLSVSKIPQILKHDTIFNSSQISLVQYFNHEQDGFHYYWRSGDNLNKNCHQTGTFFIEEIQLPTVLPETFQHIFDCANAFFPKTLIRFQVILIVIIETS